jgi:hypothetical protein
MMPRVMRSIALLVATVMLCAAGGCVVVKPYQREQLSERVMTPGSETVEDRFRQHWQGSREGASGGFGSAGGGCGCN